mmetsp:Transcript_21257/g.54032  ORF Transcript_21257/g.54032 Transcript_21257/m.54032 type:complete len:208 (+) Transcript_21257:507-1130(+)
MTRIASTSTPPPIPTPRPIASLVLSLMPLPPSSSSAPPPFPVVFPEGSSFLVLDSVTPGMTPKLAACEVTSAEKADATSNWVANSEPAPRIVGSVDSMVRAPFTTSVGLLPVGTVTVEMIVTVVSAVCSSERRPLEVAAVLVLVLPATLFSLVSIFLISMMIFSSENAFLIEVMKAVWNFLEASEARVLRSFALPEGMVRICCIRAC